MVRLAGISTVVSPVPANAKSPTVFTELIGITKYEFKGATAPLLETQYSPVIDEIMDDSTSYRGFYYANFEGDFIFYANMASGNVAPLTICRPDNGVGTFFAEGNATRVNLPVFTNVPFSTFLTYSNKTPSIDMNELDLTELRK